MSGAAGGAAIAAVEVYFKDYLVLCEYLKLDPTKDYVLGVVKLRADMLLKSLSGTDKQKRKLERKINWFLRNYKRLTGFWYGFPQRCTKLIKKDRLKINEGTVEDEYTTTTQTQQNYDYFAEKEKKYLIIGLIIVGGAILFTGTVLLLALV